MTRALAALFAFALAATLVLWETTAHAATLPTLDLTSPGRVDVRAAALLKIDPSGKRTAEEVLREAEGGALPRASETAVHQGFQDAAYWLVATVVSREPGTRFLRIFHTIDHAELHAFAPDGRATHVHTGRREPFAERPVQEAALALPLTLEANVPMRIAVRLASGDVVRLDLDAVDPATYTEGVAGRRLFWGICYGMIAALCLYNLVLLFWLRDRAYLYYVLFQGGLGLLMATFDQLTLQYFWPRSPNWSSDFETVAVMTSAFGAAGFVRVFLSSKNAPAPNARWLRGVQAAAIVLLLGFPLTDYKPYALVAIVFVVVVNVSVLYTAIRAVRQGHEGARFFLVAWSLLTASATVILLSGLSNWDLRAPMENLLRVSSVTEAVLLSFGLALRVNRIRAEHEQMGKEMLRQRVEALDHLVSGVVHEIANPLHFVRSGAEIVAMRAKPPNLSEKVAGDVADALAIVDNGTRRIDLILTNLRTQTSGARRASPEPTNLAAVLRETLALLRTRLDDQKIEVVCEANDLPEVPSRPGELGQVFTNLFLNACQAMPDGGRLEVRAEAKEEAVHVTVADSGPGVSAENKSRIFDPFFTTRGPKEGTGLGLYVSLQILWGLGGRLELVPSATGAQFLVVVPCASAASDSA